MCSAHRLMMLYMCVKFLESQMVFNLQIRHKYMCACVEMVVFNVQRAITSELGNLKLWFMHSVCCPMVLYICVKFHENISNRTELWSRQECPRC